MNKIEFHSQRPNYRDKVGFIIRSIMIMIQIGDNTEQGNIKIFWTRVLGNLIQTLYTQ